MERRTAPPHINALLFFAHLQVGLVAFLGILGGATEELSGLLRELGFHGGEAAFAAQEFLIVPAQPTVFAAA